MEKEILYMVMLRRALVDNIPCSFIGDHFSIFYFKKIILPVSTIIYFLPVIICVGKGTRQYATNNITIE